MLGVHRSIYVPVRAWQAQIMEIRDDTTYHFKSVYSTVREVCGMMRLLPGWKNRRVRFPEWGELSLDAYFESGVKLKATEAAEMLQLEPGTIVIIAGDLSEKKYHRYERYEYLKTKCNVESFVVDPSKGKTAPLAAQLLTADDDEFTRGADLRFATECPSCKTATEPVAGEYIRFCPSCQR